VLPGPHKAVTVDTRTILIWLITFVICAMPIYLALFWVQLPRAFEVIK
jgi:hypothetical protein